MNYIDYGNEKKIKKEKRSQQQNTIAPKMRNQQMNQCHI